MEKDVCEIKNAIYEGFCIYNVLNGMILIIEGEMVSIEDKKLLSLYLGVMNSVNSISNKLNKNEFKIKINYEKIDKESYYNIYNKEFKNILFVSNLKSIQEYFDSLLSKDIVIKFNREYKIYLNNKKSKSNIGNKQLVKK